MRMFWKIVIAAIVFILVAYFGIGSLCAAWGAHMDIPGYSTRIQVAFEHPVSKMKTICEIFVNSHYFSVCRTLPVWSM